VLVAIDEMTGGVDVAGVVKVWSVEVDVKPPALADTTAKWYVDEAARPLSIIECEVTKAALDEAEPYAVVRPYTTFELAASSVVQVVVAPVYEVLVAIEEMTGGVLRTVTVTEEVARLPEVSAATAESV
jgi:hypothetical protein